MKSLIYKTILIIFICCFSSLDVFSQTSSATFLKLGVGGRGTAMGYAFAPIVDDATSSYWNPAGLGKVNKTNFILSFNKWFAEIYHGYAGAAIPMGVGTVGVGVIYLTTDKMTRTEAKSGGGYIETGDFTNKDLAGIVSFGTHLPVVLNGIDVGASVKYISSTLDDKTASGILVDVGANLNYMFVDVSVVVKNIGSKLKFADEEFSAPMQIFLGGAVSLLNNMVTPAVSILKDDTDDMKILAGIELRPINLVAIRAGYRTGFSDISGNLTGLTAGIGFNVKNIGLDYSYNGFGDLGHVHQVSLSFNL